MLKERKSKPCSRGDFSRTNLAKYRNALEFVSKIIPDDFFMENIVDPFNQRLDSPKVAKKKITFRNKDLDIEEFRVFFGAHLLVHREGKRLKDNVRRFMNPDRYFYLMNHLEVDLERISKLLGKKFLKIWEPGVWIAADEFMLSNESYQSKKDGVHRYIDGKPHENGILTYEVTSRSTKTQLPFVLQMKLWLQPGLSPSDCVVKLISEIKDSYPHFNFCVVADAAFGNKATLGLLHQLKIFGLLSINKSNFESLSTIGGYGLSDREARFYKRKEESVIVYRRKDKTLMYMTNVLRAPNQEQGTQLEDSLADEFWRCSKAFRQALAVDKCVPSATTST